MATIKIDVLVQDFRKALQLKCPYVSPGNTTMSTIKNGVDCSGIFCAAFKHQGGSIYHGSNTIWRKYLSSRGAISDTSSSNGYKKAHGSQNPLKSSQLQVGMAVFKWNSATPSKFNDNLGDYQHIGLVVSVKPLRIIHASSATGGMTQDTKIGNWCAWGKMKDCNYSSASTATSTTTATPIVQEQEVSDSMYGTLKTKVNLNIRSGKSTSSGKLGNIPMGTKVQYTGDASQGWVKITYNKITGYICTKSSYVSIISKSTSQAEQASIPSETVNTQGTLSALNIKLQTGFSVQESIYDLQGSIEQLWSRIYQLEQSIQG